MTLDANNLKIAIQKNGRLTEGSLDLLKNIGLEFEPPKTQLFSSVRNFPLEILFLRDDDIPEYVQDGVSDLGIVGMNIVAEKGSNVEILEELGFGNCRLSLAVPEKSGFQDLRDLDSRKIATSYPTILRKFLKENNMKATIIEISGSVEIAPALNIADAIFDLVSSGSTLKTHGLFEIEKVLSSQALIIKGPVPFENGRNELLQKLLMRIRALLRAKQTKYIMMNAPASALEYIKQIVPGLKSPTVLPLSEPGMIAIHSVVPETIFWEVIEKLKACGATDILVSPIEKLILS